MKAGGDAILLIDDDVELCTLLAEYLEAQGYQVTAVHDGSSGLRSALEEHHQLVILDVMLPVLDGFEVLRQLRKRSWQNSQHRTMVAGQPTTSWHRVMVLTPRTAGIHVSTSRRART